MFIRILSLTLETKYLDVLKSGRRIDAYFIGRMPQFIPKTCREENQDTYQVLDESFTEWSL